MQDIPVHLLLVDDQPMVRAGLALLLELEPQVQVIGQAGSGAEALRLAAELGPDVILMDICMPQMSGIEATARLRELGGPPVILLTTFEDSGDIVAGLRAGVAGYLFKDAELHELTTAIRQVMRGEKAIHPKVVEKLALAGLEDPAPTLSGPLTEREGEILNMLAAGHPNKRIARDLGISESTVKTHLANLMRKMQVGNRTEAVYKARQMGLLG